MCFIGLARAGLLRCQNCVRQELLHVQAKNGSKGKAGNGARVVVAKVKKTNQWALRESEFAEGLVGGKSRNLATLR